MQKRIGSPAWKYQLKYSTKLTKRCAYDAQKVTDFADSLEESTKAIAQQMTAAKGTFAKAANADWLAWNCGEMYPAPQKIDLGTPGWLGGVSAAAKKGFAIYNVAKDLIPGGSKAGAGDVPGSGAEMELGWKETAAGLGKKLKDELDENDEDKEAAWKKRVFIWQQALTMCKADKAAFAEEIEEVKTTMRKMEKPIAVTKVESFTLKAALDKYNDDVGAAELGDMEAAETSAAAKQLKTLEAAVQAAHAAAQARGEKARALKDTLLG